MRTITWTGPDGDRYEVSLVRELGGLGYDTIVFSSVDEGWTGATRIAAGLDLRDLIADDLVHLLARVRR